MMDASRVTSFLTAGAAALLAALLITLAMMNHCAIHPHVPTYADLAAQTVPHKFQAAVALLPNLTSLATPDGVKELRQALLLAREHLDFFSYALPLGLPAAASGAMRNDGAAAGAAQGDDAPDVWGELREDLDSGYTLLGDFQVSPVPPWRGLLALASRPPGRGSSLAAVPARRGINPVQLYSNDCSVMCMRCSMDCVQI